MTEFKQEETLDVAFQKIIRSMLLNIHTAMPAQIVSFDGARQMCSVQPVFQRKRVGEDPAPLPVIEDVPIVYPGSGDWWVTFDLKPGSYVVCLFAERALETWLTEGGESIDPKRNRIFDLSDAIAIPGLNPLPDVLSGGVASDAIEIRKADGSVSLKVEDGTVTVDGADLQVNGDISATGNIEAQGNIEAGLNVEAGVNIEAGAVVSAQAITPATKIDLPFHIHGAVGEVPVGSTPFTGSPIPGQPVIP